MKRHKSRYKYFNVEFERSQGKSFQERISAVRDEGKNADIIFSEKYNAINNWFTNDFDQLYILSFCMRYFLMGPKGYDEEAETGSLSFPPHYLEILQAMALSHKRVYSARPLMEVEKLRDDMKEVGRLMQLKLFNLPAQIETDVELQAYLLRTKVMGYNLAVRNWAYFHQMKQVSADMASAIRHKFASIYKADPVHFVSLIFAICSEVELRINDHIRKIRTALSHKNYRDILRTYDEVFGNTHAREDAIANVWDLVGKNLANLRGFLLAHSDLRLPRLFTFTVEELIALSGNTIDKEVITVLFDKLSLKFGELQDFRQEYAVLDNPVHIKPFIKTEDGYFSSLWTSIAHLTLPMLEYLISEDESLRNSYNIQRAKYLEDQIEILFRKSFPTAQIFRGSQWVGADRKQYENDLLVIIDSFALIIEAKSGSITRAAKRGAPDRLFKTIKELIEEPSNQALRFIEYLKANRGEHNFKTNGSGTHKVNTGGVNYFVPVGITFYHFGVLGANLKLLIDSGVVEKKIHELAPSISLTDLQVIFEILETDAQKIHYLHRRRELEIQVNYFADELDLLGFYLDTGFNLGDKENDPALFLNLSIKSKELDPYFNAKDTGEQKCKPVLAMTAWWKDILKSLATRGQARWIELSYVLLNLNESAQKDLESGFKKLASKIARNDVEQEHNWASFRTANEQRHYVVVIYPYLEKHRKDRHQIISNIIGEELERYPNAKGIAVIGINLSKDHYPYSILAGDLSATLFEEQFSSMSTL